MSSNFLVWNPTGANQETDAEYLVDAQRLDGAANPSIFTSKVGNKVLHQASVFYTALAQALAAKGYVVSDASLATLAGVLANIVTQVDLVSALAIYAPLVSPALAGAPTAPTPAIADNSSRVATTAFVKGQGYLASITAAMVLSALGFTPVQQGGGAGQAANKIYIGYDNAAGHLRVTVDATDFGDLAWTSDLAAYLPVNNPVVGGTMNITGQAIIPGPPQFDNSTRVPNTNWVWGAFAPLANPALTGTPTAPTSAAGTRSTKLATMQAFTDEFFSSIGTSGFQRLPTGLLIQWGQIGGSLLTPGNAVHVTFPAAFNALPYAIALAPDCSINANTTAWFSATQRSASGFDYTQSPGTQFGSFGNHTWIAIGV